MDEKKIIRNDLINKRDSIDSDTWNRDSKIIQKNIILSDIYKKSDCILCYSDFHGEVGTLMIIEDALLSGKKVFLPKVLQNFTEARMDFYEIISTNELIDGYKGIMEPTGNREKTFNYDEWSGKRVLMTVPGVAFSNEGYRLGYGLGYYDLYLSDKPSIIKAGICFSMQIAKNIPILEHDIKMDFLFTEKTSVAEINEICKDY